MRKTNQNIQMYTDNSACRTTGIAEAACNGSSSGKPARARAGLLLLTMLCTAAFSLAACGSKTPDSVSSASTTAAADSTAVADSAAVSDSAAASIDINGQEINTVTGTIDEIKDFMFTLTDDKGMAYQLSFDAEHKPEGLSQVSNGDKVTVQFTGTYSEADPFEGIILSVKKAV